MSNISDLQVITQEKFKLVTDSWIATIKAFFPTIGEKALEIMANISDRFGAKYSILEMHFIEEVKSTLNYATFGYSYIMKNLPPLLATTNNLSELYSIPVNDYTLESYTHDGESFTMTEDQPLDATENITTPYIKNKGKAGYTASKRVEHNTVDEAEKRQKMTDTMKSLYEFTEGLTKQVVYEYNVAY